MIKTLRITSIIVAVLAVVFVVFPAVFGVRSNEGIEEFLNSAGAIEEFKKAKGAKVKASESQVSPLVKQAEAFALYLNPPAKPKKTTVSRTRKPSVKHRPTTVSAKFTLIGTSYYALHPELSLALIDEPGKGLRWVRQSSEVGHLIIEQVKDGLIVVKDGQRAFELVAERPERRSLLKDSSSGETSKIPSQRRDEEKSAWAEKVFVELEATPPDAEAGKTDSEDSESEKEGIASITKRRAPWISDEEALLTEKIFATLEAEAKAVEAGVESGEIDSDAALEKFISDLASMRISAEEAKRLDHLGRELEDVGQEPNQAKVRSVEPSTVKPEEK